MAAEEKKPQSASDFGIYVMRSILKLGLATIPQNFELYYASMGGSHPELAKELEALGPAPAQADVDLIANRFFADRLSVRVADVTHQKLNKSIGNIQDIISNENQGLDKYSAVITKATRQLITTYEKNGNLSAAQLLEAIKLVVVATEDRSKECRSVNEKISTEAQELERTKKELENYKELARIDHLTRVLNRRSFDDEIAKIYDDGSFENCCLMMMDIDHFKKFNDTHGHQFGDAILRRVAETIRNNVRPDVTVARVGGEEFAIITRNVDPQIAKLIAERVRSAVEAMDNIDRKSGKNYGTITVSIGVCMAVEADSAPRLYANADEMLYSSKKNGRNRVTIYNDPESDGNYEGKYLREPFERKRAS